MAQHLACWPDSAQVSMNSLVVVGVTEAVTRVRNDSECGR